jgi:PhoH-like ATPase
MIYYVPDLESETLRNIEPQENDFFFANNELYRLRNKTICPIIPNKKFKVQPLNEEHLAFRNLFEDDQVKIINLRGIYGSGKSYMSLGCALEAVLVKETFSKILILRELIPATKFNAGYLPGNIKDKTWPHFAAINDSLESLAKKTNGLLWGDDPMEIASTLSRSGKIEFSTLEFLRGRNLSDTIILADDSQNLDIDNVRLIVTRLADNSKIIFNGDLGQIDNRRMEGVPGTVYLDRVCQNQPEYAKVEFTHAECRSDIIARFAQWEATAKEQGII